VMSECARMFLEPALLADLLNHVCDGRRMELSGPCESHGHQRIWWPGGVASWPRATDLD
jgi:hypothetical protein